MAQPVAPARVDGGSVARPTATGPRSGESVPRPQWEGLFLAPDWPPDEETD